MQMVKLSSKYQLSIPKAVREQLHLQSGQKFSVITKGDVIELVPVRTIESVRGLLKQANPNDYRDRSDRY